jgi:hypothetical protein
MIVAKSKLQELDIIKIGGIISSINKVIIQEKL